MDAERTKRSAAAKVAANARHAVRNADRNADRNAVTLPTTPHHTNVNKVVQGTTAAREEDDETIVLLAQWGAHVKPDGNGVHKKLVDLIRRRGLIDVTAALRRAHDADPNGDGAQYVFEAENLLRPRPSSRKEPKGYEAEDKEAARNAFKRG